MRYSIVKNDKVINRIVAEDEEIAKSIADEVGATYTSDQSAKMGYELVDGVWEKPDNIAQERQNMKASAAQGMIAMDDKGVLDDVETYMNASGTPRRHKLAWQKASTLDRNGQIIGAVANELGWTETFLDDLFRHAMSIEV